MDGVRDLFGSKLEVSIHKQDADNISLEQRFSIVLSVCQSVRDDHSVLVHRPTSEAISI